MPTDNQQSRQFQQTYGAGAPDQRYFWQGYSSRLLGIVEGENGATYEGVVSGNASLPLGAEVLFIPGERPNDIGMIVKPDLGTPSQEAAADMNEVGTIVRAGDPNVDPIIRGRVVDKRHDTLYDPDTFTLYRWDKETRAWIPISQLARGTGVPSIASTVAGGWYFRESNGDVYKGSGSAWTLFSGGGGGGSASAALGIETTAYLAENTPAVLAFNSDASYKAWDNGSFWNSGNPTRITFASEGFYEITMHSPCDMYSANNSQTEWDCKVRIYNSSGVQQVTYDRVQAWYMLTAAGMNDLQYFNFSMPVQMGAGWYLTIEVKQSNSATGVTLKFARSDYAWVTVKTLG